MAYSNTVPASEFKQSSASGQHEFKQSVASGQRQARLMLKIIAGVAALAFVFAALGKFTGIGADHIQNGAVVATYDVTMMVEGNDAVALRSMQTGEVIVGFDKGHGGFLRGAIRAFGLKRNQMKIAADAPFTVTKWESGRVTLNDPSTGHQVPVDAFGPMVTKMFAPLVETKK